MEQKTVKIIGLRINEQMGILQSCELKFDSKSNLIAVKGEVGSGKSTLQKGLQLGTQGSDTLKSDKLLYGKIDEEIQLLDGERNVFIGCKTTKKGALDYVIYTKDEDGKIDREPVIDGVKCTPADYLKNLQTDLTWRMDELTSESTNVQKKILLDLYKPELAKIGVVFDKKSEKYTESILGKIDLAINTRSEKDFERRKVGGFSNQLDVLGVDVSESDTYPKRIDISKLEERKNKLQYDIDNIDGVKEQRLSELKTEAKGVTLKLKEANSPLMDYNSKLEEQFTKIKHQYSQNTHTLNGILNDFMTLRDGGCFNESDYQIMISMVHDNFKNIALTTPAAKEVLEFDENGSCVTDEWDGSKEIGLLLIELMELRVKYGKLDDEPAGDTGTYEEELKKVVNQIILDKKNNEKCDMLDAYLAWKKADNTVHELRDEYAKMLSSVNTGVNGLNINVDKEDEKLSIYLTYNGVYDKKYFNNPSLEHRKLSSYSGTQKPLICLLLQNYLLSKKEKAMRYLWIDNVPIDAKTKKLLNKMGEDLGVVIIVNITGDFSKETLENGEILIEGGEVFFK